MEQHAQQAEMHVHLLQEANASLADERAALMQVIHLCCHEIGLSEGRPLITVLKHFLPSGGQGRAR